MHQSLLSILLLLLSMVFFTDSANAGELLKIGVSLGLTGQYAELSGMSMKGYKLWEQDVNSKGGLLGRKVHFVIYDDKSDPSTAHLMYERLIENDKVDLVIGPYSSEITEAVIPITERHHYPLLAAGAAADVLWQRGYKYLFGVYVPTSKYMVSFLEMLASNGITQIAMLGADDLFSKDLASGAKEWVKRFGLNVVFFEEFKKGTKVLSDATRRAQASGAQALVVFGHLDESINARLALKEIGWSPRAYYATVGPSLERFHEILNADAEYVFSSSQWEPTSPFPGAKEFTENFLKTYHISPSYHAAAAYATGQILEAAIRKSQSFNRDKISDVLSSLDAMTIMGRYGVDRTGRQIRYFAISIQWQNGRKEIVAPKELMTAPPIWR